MNRIINIIALLSLCCAVSCQISQIAEQDMSQKEITVTAGLENDGAITIDGEETIPDTKTTRLSDGKVWWCPGDEISIFYGDGTAGGSKFTCTLTEKASIAKFSGKIGVITGGGDDAVEAYTFHGIYPYDASNAVEAKALKITFPVDQKSADGDFAPGQNITAAESSALAMSFLNVGCGYKFKVKNEGIKKVVFSSADFRRPIAGRVNAVFVSAKTTIVPQINAVPVGSQLVTVTPLDGGSFKPGIYYYAVMIPDHFDAGMSMTFYTDTQKATYKCVMTGDKPEHPSGRSKFKVMDNKDDGLTWTALPDAGLTGKFSVSATRKVSFAKGNLYYNGSSWAIENNQYDFRTWPGKNACISGSLTQDGTPSGNVGTFYWSTDPANAIKETSTETIKDYYDPLFANVDASIIGPEWYCLNQSEWRYLIEERPNAAKKIGYGTVGGVTGIIILPDSFTDPKKNGGSGAFVPNSSDTHSWTENVYTSGTNWNAMEKAGAVFLPKLGYRQGTEITNNITDGVYLAAESAGPDSISDPSLYGRALVLVFGAGNIETRWWNRDFAGYGVRLAKVVELTM